MSYNQISHPDICDFFATELDEGGNEVWDDLGSDPTEAERRKGNRVAGYASL